MRSAPASFSKTAFSVSTAESGLVALELMDAAGMRTLAGAAGAFPGRSVVVEGANPLVRKCWELLGYDDPAVPVELVA